MLESVGGSTGSRGDENIPPAYICHTHFALNALGPREHALHPRRPLEQKGVERVCVARSEKKSSRGEELERLCAFVNIASIPQQRTDDAQVCDVAKKIVVRLKAEVASLSADPYLGKPTTTTRHQVNTVHSQLRRRGAFPLCPPLNRTNKQRVSSNPTAPPASATPTVFRTLSQLVSMFLTVLPAKRGKLPRARIRSTWGGGAGSVRGGESSHRL